ncbi:hypothetical protein [Phaeovulum veldkampii]|nr:hypothetical protein [Phaeovulum veldkampii]TDQ57108.1 hypothetical protein EV658_11467 [Phaeovulum veldkampii DSM 11550]
MAAEHFRSRSLRSASACIERMASTGRVILVVEPAHHLPSSLRGVTGTQIFQTGHRELDGALLDRVQPDVALCPLMVAGFDALDLAERLVSLGYRGALRATTQPVPDRNLILREIRAICPGLDFDLIELPAP